MDMDMEIEDVVSLQASSSAVNGSGHDEINGLSCQLNQVNSQSLDVQETNVKRIRKSSGDVAGEENQLLLPADNDNDTVENRHLSEVSTEAGLSQGGNTRPHHTLNGFLVGSEETNTNSLSAEERLQLTADEQQPSIQVIYKYLTRDSKRKLEELLQKWSQWHAENCSSSYDSGSIIESGQETYFPALRVGQDKTSAMSFRMENEMSIGQNKDSVRFDGNFVPLYDRGYSLALTSADDSNSLEGEVVGDSRCFNCASYNHSLKDCPKPRDNVAVNNARKQHKFKRNQNVASRNPTRYYQSTPRGKYDGLKPGALDAETRKLLGLGALDPPPWLNRMREIGYPPGYLEVDDEPSGLTIFGSEESRDETEEGEILEVSCSGASKKMSVEFPGVNAPIPENADEERWIATSSDSLFSRNHSSSRYNRPADPISRSHYHDQRWTRDFEDDEPLPPGCEPDISFPSSHSRRYGGFESGYTYHSPRDNPMIPRSSSFGRSISDRSRRSPLYYDYDDSPRHHSYGSYFRSSPRYTG